MSENGYTLEEEEAERAWGPNFRVGIILAIICLCVAALLEVKEYLPPQALPVAGHFHMGSHEAFIERARASAQNPAGRTALRHFPRVRQQRGSRADRAFIPGHMDGNKPRPGPPRAGTDEVQVLSLEVWPAAGGGFLLGVIVPALSGRAPRRHTVKTLFLRIGLNEFPTVIIPYVPLEREVLACAKEIVAAELGADARHVVVDNNVPSERSGAITRLADLCPASELNLMVLGAIARGLLTTAAARFGGALQEEERADGATVAVSYGDLVRDAALLDLPRFVTLRSGRRVRLRGDDATADVVGRNR